MAINIIIILCGLTAFVTILIKNTKAQLLFFILSQYFLSTILFINQYHFLSIGYAFLMTGSLLVMVLVSMLDYKEYLRFGTKWKRYLYGSLSFVLVVSQTGILFVVFLREDMFILENNKLPVQIFEIYKTLFTEYYFALGVLALLLVVVTYALIVVKRDRQ